MRERPAPSSTIIDRWIFPMVCDMLRAVSTLRTARWSNLTPVPDQANPVPSATTKTTASRLPAASVDVHSHILHGGASRVPGARYQPFDAPLPAYEAHLTDLGVSRGVIVTASTYGTDNAIMLDALRSSRLSLRGVAIVDPDTVTDQQLESMHTAGVRGLRLQDLFPGGTPLKHLHALGARVADLGWHLEIWTDFSKHLEWLPTAIRQSQVPVVIDHLGYYYGDTVQHRSATQALIELARERCIWVTLSGAYRIVPGYHAGRDALWLSRHVETLLEQVPSRLVWGSDWPHVASPCPPPTTSNLVAEVTRWCAHDVQLLERVLAANPAGCYGF